MGGAMSFWTFFKFWQGRSEEKDSSSSSSSEFVSSTFIDTEEFEFQFDSPTNPSLFHWPEKPTNEDGALQFPFSKRKEHHGPGSRALAINPLEALQKRVAACIEFIDPNVGNIVPLIASYLNTAIAEKERNLLPKIDWIYPYYEVSTDCVAMLQDKIARAQRQHAHDLALKGMVDIVVTWECLPFDFKWMSDYALKRIVYVSLSDAHVLKKASEGQYKPLDWDRMFYQVKGPSRRTQSRVAPKNHGGFYACVSYGIYQDLLRLSENYGRKIGVKTILTPKLMTKEKQLEIKQYHVSRAFAGEQTDFCKYVELQAAADEAAEKDHAKRRANTYSKAQQDAVDSHQRVDFRLGAATVFEKYQKQQYCCYHQH